MVLVLSEQLEPQFFAHEQWKAKIDQSMQAAVGLLLLLDCVGHINSHFVAFPV